MSCYERKKDAASCASKVAVGPLGLAVKVRLTLVHLVFAEVPSEVVRLGPGRHVKIK